jgi:hypothetical protein
MYEMPVTLKVIGNPIPITTDPLIRRALNLPESSTSSSTRAVAATTNGVTVTISEKISSINTINAAYNSKYLFKVWHSIILIYSNQKKQ